MDSLKNLGKESGWREWDVFPGLRPFQPSDFEFFSGREKQKYQILKNIGDANFIAIVGAKGIGKTSFLNAVVIPELEKGFVVKGQSNWKIASMRPGRDPIGALASALALIPSKSLDVQSGVDPNLSDQFEAILRDSKMGVIEILEQQGFLEDSNLLIQVDQLDDLVLHEAHDSSESRTREVRLFINRLVECVGQTAYPITILTSLRSENLGEFSEFFQLAEIINKNQFLLGPLLKSEIIQVLERTVKRASLQYEQALVDEINDFLKVEPIIPGQFQHAMMRSVYHWRHKGSINEVGKDDLYAIGGMDGSIQAQLQEIYNSFHSRKKKTCQLCFQALTAYSHLGDVYIVPRRIEELAEITDCELAEIVDVLNPFIARDCGAVRVLESNEIDRRLEKLDALSNEAQSLITAKSLISISQELVLEKWLLLKEWIEEERRDSLFYVDIGRDVDKGEHPYQGKKLIATLSWYNKKKPHLAWANRYKANFILIEDFIARSKELYERELAIKEAEEESRKKVKARNRTIVGAFVLGLLVLLVFNFLSGQRAAKDREDAKIAWKVAERKDTEAKNSAELAKLAEKKGKMATLDSKLKKEEARLASLKAAREGEIADSLKLESDSLNAEFKIKAADLSLAIAKVDESRKLEEYLNILEQVRELSEGARNKILNNPEDESQLKLAVNMAWNAYEKFKETNADEYSNLADSVTVLKDYRQKKLFSTMNLAYQRAKSSPMLVDLDHGIVIDSYNNSSSADESGKFLVGTSIENSIVQVDIENGQVTGVWPWALAVNQKELVRGIKDLKLSSSGKHLLISNLPVNQEGRFISTFNADGDFKTAVNMKSQIESIFRFGRHEFLLVDQNSNLYKLGNLDKDVLDTIRTYSVSKDYMAVDYNEELNSLFLAHSGKNLVFLKLDSDARVEEIERFTPSEFSDDITAIKIIPKHNLYALATIRGEVYFYDLQTHELIYEATDEHANRINCMELSSDGNVLVSGGRDRKVNVWALPELLEMAKNESEVRPFKPIQFTETESVRDISFVGNDWIIVVSSNEGFGSSRGGKVSLLTLDFNLTGNELGKLKTEIAGD